MNKRESVYHVLQKILLCVMVVFSFVTIAGAVFFFTRISWGTEYNKSVLVAFELFFSLQLMLLIGFLFKLTDKADTPKKSYIITAAYFIFAVIIMAVLFCNLNPRPVTDSYDDLNAARVIMNEGYFTLDNPHAAEVKQFSNNFLLIIVFKAFLTVFDTIGITDIYRVFYVINALTLLLGNFLVWKFIKEARGHKAANKVLCLFVLNPVYYMLIFWIYQVLVSYPLLVGVVYCMYKIRKAESRKKVIIWSVVFGLVSFIAYKIRPTNIFPIIAAALIMIFILDFKKKWKKGLVVVLAALIAVVPMWMFVNNRVDKYFSEVSDSTYSLYYWFSLGSHDNGGTSTKTVEKTIISEYGDDFEGRDAAFRDYVIENYKNMGITGVCNLWLRKIIVNWSDGYCDLEIRHTEGNHDSMLYEYLVGNRSELFVIYCQAYRLVTMIGFAIYALNLIRKKNISLLDTVLFLSVAGGYVFYLIWEVKSVYSLVLAPFILILAVPGFEWFGNKTSSQKKITVLPYVIGALLSVLLLVSFGRETSDFMYYRVHGTYNNRHRIKILDGETVNQTFRCAKPFNVIELPVAVSEGENDALYVYRLSSADGTLQTEGSYCAESVRDDTLTITPGTVLPEGEYSLEITKESDSDSYVAVYTYNSYYYDQYDGVLHIDGEEQTGDLRMRVGYSANERYFSNTMTITVVVLYLVFSVCGVGCLVMRKEEGLTEV